MKVKTVLIFLLIISLMTVTACKNGNGKDKDAQTLPDDTISLCMKVPDTLNPILTKNDSNMRIYDLIYDSLVYVDKEMRPVSCLAEKCTTANEGKTIKFTLKDGILWHDGKVFSAYDVEYTFNEIKNTEESVYYSRLSNVESYEATDNMHFNINLYEPNVNILNLLDFPIIPIHNTEPEKKPIGTGMYKFVTIKDREKMVLTRNDEWNLGDKPGFKTINVLFSDSDEDMFSLVKMGKVTAVATDISNVGQLGADNNIKIAPYSSLQYEFLGMNYENGALSSDNVRKAISSAVNRSEIVKNVYYDCAEAANAPIPSESWIYDKSYNRFGYDKEEAIKYLTDDGYTDTDGVYRKKADNGADIVLEFAILVNDDNDYRIKSGEMICKSLSEIGINAHLEKLPFEQYIERIEAGEYSMFLGGYDLSADLDFRFMLSSDSIENKTNVFRYSSIDMDRATKDICTPTTDEGIKKAYSYFQMVFSRDVPFAGIAFVQGVFFYSNDLDIVDGFVSNKIYRDINSWNIKK